MKQKYEKPMLEVDNYELDVSIASNCARVVNIGPAYGGRELCDKYAEYEPFSVRDQISTMSNYNIDFWENCDCYTGASGMYFTS